MGKTTPEYHWLLPAGLTGTGDSGVARRRSTRDWVVDTLCFVLGLGYALLATVSQHHPNDILPGWENTPTWLFWTDFVTGVLAAAALWWRRRWPVGLALVTMPISLYSTTAGIALMIMLFTVAVHRRFTVTAAIAGLSLATGTVVALLRPEREMSFWPLMAWAVVGTVIIVLWGMVLRSRRLLVVSLRDRAERAESEQLLRIAQARVLERTRIAREMHDVLAHRISLVSLHAGALEINPGATGADVAEAAAVIRASAHQALEDLREVIGVLREPSDDPTPERPQPTLGELAALVDESRAAGVRVTLDVGVAVPEQVPGGTGRTAYRIVQEGLTNARKHAPGAAVRVGVEGTAGDGLTLRIRNRWPVPGSQATFPGSQATFPGSQATVPGRPTGVPSKQPAVPSRQRAVPGRPTADPGRQPADPGGRGMNPGSPSATGGDHSAIPGTGTGLVGLTERAALAGGTLDHGTTAEGEFVLTAWLPWSA